jgi:hypothetical protein
MCSHVFDELLLADADAGAADGERLGPLAPAPAGIPITVTSSTPG